MGNNSKYTNNLINESSPYLLQHAHNPVNWEAWNTNSLQRAIDEDKLILVSIGYSSCHWCHVMERECFEDETLAQLMNDFFVCIKIDREERPDIDQFYMQAVQLMGQNGGWPLNCFCLPDTRPIYGGTYFRPEQWRNVLISLIDLKSKEHSRLIEYANKLEKGIKQLSELPVANHATALIKEDFIKSISEWVNSCDFKDGGPNYAPKFPMPVNYDFLLNFSVLLKDKKVEEFVKLTMDKMCRGGIYDQAGGGFARYSVDGYWKIPHFEKMLYDNGQLIELYSKAYKYFKSEEYKEVVYQSIEFLEREFKNENGLYYSALDADSEGIEGKYYVWHQDELKSLLGDDYSFYQRVYNKDEIGFWENNEYVLMRAEGYAELANELNISTTELIDKVKSLNYKILGERKKRVIPGLDYKCLLSWNCILLNGLIEAAIVFCDNSILSKAVNLYDAINKGFIREGELLRVNTNSKPFTEAFCEDYAYYVNANINLYLATANNNYLQNAIDFQLKTNELFYNKQTGFYYFNPLKSKELVANKADTNDNVIPSSNSICALNNFLIYKITGEENYFQTYQTIINKVYPYFLEQPSGYSLFGKLISYEMFGFKEIVISGVSAEEEFNKLQQHYIPNSFMMKSDNNNNEYLFKDRLNKDKTLIYICENNSCKQPLNNANEAYNFLLND